MIDAPPSSTSGGEGGAGGDDATLIGRLVARGKRLAEEELGDAKLASEVTKCTAPNRPVERSALHPSNDSVEVLFGKMEVSTRLAPYPGSPSEASPAATGFLERREAARARPSAKRRLGL